MKACVLTACMSLGFSRSAISIGTWAATRFQDLAVNILSGIMRFSITNLGNLWLQRVDILLDQIIYFLIPDQAQPVWRAWVEVLGPAP